MGPQQMLLIEALQALCFNFYPIVSSFHATGLSGLEFTSNPSRLTKSLPFSVCVNLISLQNHRSLYLNLETETSPQHREI